MKPKRWLSTLLVGLALLGLSLFSGCATTKEAPYINSEVQIQQKNPSMFPDEVVKRNVIILRNGSEDVLTWALGPAGEDFIWGGELQPDQMVFVLDIFPADFVLAWTVKDNWSETPVFTFKITDEMLDEAFASRNLPNLMEWFWISVTMTRGT